MLVLEKKYNWHKRWNETTQQFTWAIPACVLVFDQFDLLLQWSPWYWDSLWASFLAGSACYSPGQQKMMCRWSFGLGECLWSEFPWKALLVWFCCCLLFDWGWKESGLVFSETQNFSPSPPPGASLFATISCHTFFPIFLHTFSHPTSETLFCVLGGLGVICWCYLCL